MNMFRCVVQWTVQVCRCSIVYCVLVATVTSARHGSPIVHCSRWHSPVEFHFSVPISASGKPTLIVHPDGRGMPSREGDFRPIVEREFWERISSLSSRSGNVSFRLSHVTASDAGDYVCREGTVRGALLPECGQTLHYIDVSQPTIMEGGLAVKGKSVSLFCVVTIPEVWERLGLKFSYEWFKDDVSLPGQNQESLTVREARESDEGLYTCRVTEGTRECVTSPSSLPFSLRVLVPPTVTIKRHVRRPLLEVPRNRYLTLTCLVESAFPGVPWDGFSWSFSPSDSSPPRQLHVTGDTLTLGPMTRKDSGRYTCQARNNEGFEAVMGPGSDSVYVSVPYLENMFLTPDVEVGEGEAITLTCTVESSPTAHLQWLVEGVLRRNVTANADNYVVAKATGRDGGKYACRASNGGVTGIQMSTRVAVTHGEHGYAVLSKSGHNRDVDKEVIPLSNGGKVWAGSTASSTLAFLMSLLVSLLSSLAA